MEVKAQIGTARMARLNVVSKQPEKLLGKSGGVQDKIRSCSRLGGKLMHPESRLRRLPSFPSHARCIEEIKVPDARPETQSLRE